MNSQQKINILSENYYNENFEFYSHGWSNEHLHYGFWFDNTKTHEESLINHINVVINDINIQENEIILDAGCGNGGTSRYISNNYNVRIHGITMSEVLLSVAHKFQKDSKDENKIKIEVMDFCNTAFPDMYFDAIIAIESSCHAENKMDFLNESYRILKKGGRICISDAFVTNNSMSDDENKIYNEFLEGWSIPNLRSLDGFHNDLLLAGFSNIKYSDQLHLILKSSNLIFEGGKYYMPYILRNYRDGSIPGSTMKHCVAQYRQYECIHRGLWTHGRFIATKE